MTTTKKTQFVENITGVKVTYNHVDSLEQVYPPQHLYTALQDQGENLRKLWPGALKDYDLQIFDDKCPDIPKNAVECTGNVCSTKPGIGNYSGLTYWWLRKSELNDNLYNKSESERDVHMGRLLAHELGHYFMESVFQNPILDKAWDKKRGVHVTKATPKAELKAEDAANIYGNRWAKSVVVGDVVKWNTVPFLKEFYDVCIGTHYVRSEVIKNGGQIIWENMTEGTDQKFAYRFRFVVKDALNLFTLVDRTYCIDSKGVWNINSKGVYENISWF